MSTVLERNNVKVLGEGTIPLLLGHGLGFDQRAWEAITPHFLRQYQVILFDYVGAGRSDVSAYCEKRYATLNGYAQDVIDICQALQLKQVTFIGHSVSAMIGALASIQQPGLIQSLIMIGPSPCYLNIGDYKGGFEQNDVEELMHLMEKNYVQWVNVLAPLSMKNEDNPNLTAQFKRSLLENNRSSLYQFARITFLSDMRNILQNISVPTLILQSSDDAIVPKAVGHYMKDMIPHSELFVLQATGHNPHISHPEEIVLHIQHYLHNGGIRC